MKTILALLLLPSLIFAQRIELKLNPDDWVSSIGEVYKRHNEGYPLPAIGFSLGLVAVTFSLEDELTAILTYYVSQGEIDGWLVSELAVYQVRTQQDENEEGEPVGDPRPVLEFPVTLVARDDHPEESVRGKVKYDTWNSESMPTPVREAHIALWAAVKNLTIPLLPTPAPEPTPEP